MSKFKPNLLFKIIDPIFLKAGKPIARYIAKKDKTDNILLKRENQSKLIVRTVIKLMELSSKILKVPLSDYIYIAFILIGSLASNYIYFFSKSHSNIFDILIRLSFTVSTASVLRDILGMILSNQNSIKKDIGFYFNQNATFLLKEDSFRIERFYKINRTTMASIIFNVINFPAYIIIIYMQNVTMYYIVLSSLYASSILFAFINWTYNYILMATIYHSDDFGEKEKQTSKEKKSAMVPDAV